MARLAKTVFSFSTHLCICMVKFGPAILQLRRDGLSYRKIQQELGCSASTVLYHLKPSYRHKTKTRTGSDVVTGRRKRRAAGVKSLGGKCVCCAYSKCAAALDFHHLAPGAKEFSLAASTGYLTLEEYKAELQKCVLVCCRCHREVHAGITQVPEDAPRFDPVIWEQFLTDGRQI